MVLETIVFTISDEGTSVKNDLVIASMEELHKIKSEKGDTFVVRGVHLGLSLV